MSDWIKVRLTGNLFFKLAGIGIMTLCLILGLSAVKGNVPEQFLGLLLAGLFVLFLAGYGLFYWAGARYLSANLETKELRFQQLFRKEQSFPLSDLTSINILKYTIRIQLHDTWYSFKYSKENAEWINFLKKNTDLWKPKQTPDVQLQTVSEFVREPEPTPNKKQERLIYTRQLFLLLIFLFFFILLLNVTRQIMVIVLLCAILISTFLMHLFDCMLLSRTYDDIYKYGTKVTGTISRFSHPIWKRGTPYFIFKDEQGRHEVPSLLPIHVTRKEESKILKQEYTLWYAPEQAGTVLYGEKEPEPFPSCYFSLLILGQMGVALVFLVILFFASSQANPTSNPANFRWATACETSSYEQADIESNTIQWFCSAYAINTVQTKRTLSLIGGIPFHDQQRSEELTASLSRDWGITNRESAIKSIKWLINEGHRTDYKNTAAFLNQKGWLSLTKAEFLEKTANYNMDYRYSAIYDAYHSFGSSGIDAWDYSRLLELLGNCYACHYISLEECLNESLPIAKQLQSEFKSWKELGKSYLYGYQYWKRLETADVKTEYESMERIFETLLVESDGPYHINYTIKLKRSW